MSVYIVQHCAACCSTNPSHFRLQKVSLKAKQLLASLGLDAVPEARAWRALCFAKSKSRGMVWFNARNVCGLVKITQDYSPPKKSDGFGTRKMNHEFRIYWHPSGEYASDLI